MKKTFILHNNFDAATDTYQKDLVRRVAGKFGLQRTLRENIPAHFTLKYWFEASEAELAELESLLQSFCNTALSSPVVLDSIQGFPPNVAFIDVVLKESALRMFELLVKELRGFPWMSWDMYDAENLHPHQTIAEECGERYSDVIEYLKELHSAPREALFDNISIIKLIGVQDGITVIEPYKTFRFGL